MKSVLSILPLLLFSSFSVYIALSYNSKHPPLSLDDLQFPDSLLGKSDFALRQMRFKDVVGRIASCATVDGPIIGYAGIQSEQYKRYLWLQEFATEDELVNLTKSLSPNLKIYSFEALMERNYFNCDTIFKEHLKDVTEYRSSDGCIGLTEYINIGYLKLMRSKFSKKEFAFYKKEISKYFDKATWERVERFDGI